MKLNNINAFLDGEPGYNLEIVIMEGAIYVMLLFTLLHVFFRTRMEGLAVVISIISVACVVEFVGVTVLETHCHGEGIVMIGSCSSLNSILRYVGWFYSCYFIGNKVPLQSTFARNLLIASLHPLFSGMYEVMGINSGWLIWNGVNNSGMHYSVKEFAALNQRVLGLPIMTVMGHFFFGVSFHWSRHFALWCTDSYLSKNITSSRLQNGSALSVSFIMLVQALIVTIIAPLLPIIPLYFLSKLVLIDSWLDISELLTGISGSTEDIPVGNIIYTAVSASIILAAIVAVFADPIFRRVNISNLNKKEEVAYAILMPDKHEDRDLLLLCIPYTFFTAIVLIVVRQFYFDFINGLKVLSILAPYRLVSLIDANFAFTLFTYFNFSQLVRVSSKKIDGDSVSPPKNKNSKERKTTTTSDQNLRGPDQLTKRK